MIPQTTVPVLRAACLLAAAFLSIVPISAASPEAAPRWVRATPFGGEITSLAQAPSAPRMIYAFAYNGRVFRSLDGGATWNRRGEAVAGFPKNVVVDSDAPQTVYAAMHDYIALRSRDGGATWTQIASEVGTIYQLAADRYHPGALFAAAADGLYRSDDGGDSWARVAFEGETVIGVAVDPRAADTVVAVTEGNDFYGEPDLFWKSTDHGTTWTSSDFPRSSYSRILEFVFDPARPESLYVLFVEFDITRPVLRSSDGGASWSELPADGIRGLAAAPDGTLFAATSYGLERSSDGGTTWVPPIEPGYAPPGGPPRDILTEIMVSSAAPGEIFAAGSSGIWKSGDNGARWAASNQGILAQGALQVAVAPTGPPAVFDLIGSLFRSADQGATWARLTSILDEPQPSVIEAIDPRHPQTIYGIADDQADFPVVSTDGGRRWSKLEIPYNCDGGDSICDVYLWSVTLDRDGSLFARGSYYFHYVGGGSYLLRSEDGGQTWKELKRPAGGIGDFAVDPRRRDTYHAVNCEGLFRSTDAGKTWKETGSGLPADLCGRHGGLPMLAINPQDPQRVYVTSGKGIFASSDRGATFRAVNRGLETGRVVTLQFDPTDSSKVYAGVAEKGVFRWNAEQRKWTPLNRGLPLDHFAGSIALDPRHPSILYAASPVEGVYRLDLDEPVP